jgi:hypothetical protein
MLIQHLEDLSEEEQAIARSLFSHGVVIWEGLPQSIVKELFHAGFVITKSGGNNESIKNQL